MLVHFSHLTHCIHVNTHTPVYTLLLGCRTTTSILNYLPYTPTPAHVYRSRILPGCPSVAPCG